MGKLRSLIGGTILGAGGMYVGLQYHVLLAPEGPLLVPRTPQHSLKEAYANVQTWDAKTWAEHPQLSLAVTEHGRSDLIGNGVKRNLLDELRETFTLEKERVSTSTRGWTPVESPNVPSHNAPSPIAQGKIADADSEMTSKSAPQRSLLPLAELFGFPSYRDRSDSAAAETALQAEQEVLPTGTRERPVVELLPAPDEVDLGKPQPLPRRPLSNWRQSEADDADGQRTASDPQETETVGDLPGGATTS